MKTSLMLGKTELAIYSIEITEDRSVTTCSALSII